MAPEERDRIYAAYGKAVIFHNSAEFVLEQFLAIELSKIRKSNPGVELANIKRCASEFGSKLRIFREEILASNSDARLQTIYDSFNEVAENRNYLAHAVSAEAGMLDVEKVFHPTGFELLEWLKKDGTIIPQRTLTQGWLADVAETAAMPIALIQEYWTPQNLKNEMDPGASS